jgi:O-glycosyl hydrolase
MIYVDEGTHAVTETKRLWAFANYSRFVRPGFVRIPAVSTVTGLKITAFRSADDKSIVLVVINDGSEPLDMRLPVIAGYTKLEAYETSDIHDLDLVLNSDVQKGYTFTGRSVTSLVFTKG